MIGVFDSGVGGLTALGHLRALMPRADICFLADRAHAPYGTKAQDELIYLVRKSIARLRERGADKILMACCTASTVYSDLSEEERLICIPIIEPTAKRAAEITKRGEIGVIATERTSLSSAFSKAIHKILPTARVTEISAQELVSLAEAGECDGYASPAAREKIIKIAKSTNDYNIDTLILGCTHFPLFKETISNVLSDTSIVSCSREGALALAKEYNDEGDGRLEFIF